MTKFCGECEHKKYKIRKLEDKLERMRDLAEKAMDHSPSKSSPTWGRLYPMFIKILDGE